MLRPIALSLLTALALSAESFDERLKATDQSSADAVYDLALWCRDQGLPAKARQYFNATIKLNRDHEGAREALGQVRVGERWVPKSQVKAATPPTGSQAANTAADEDPAPTGGKGPAVSEITWKVPVPIDPAPQNTFVTTYIERMPTVGNESSGMESAIETILLADNVESGIPRLIAALQRGGYHDLYGPANILVRLPKDGHIELAKALIGPLTAASLEPHEPEDLAAYCDAVAVLNDKRVVPRLGELLDHPHEDVQHCAARSLSQLTGLPATGLTSARISQWWNTNWNRSDRDIFRAQLRSKDPTIALAAARALGTLKDKDAVDVAITWFRSDDPRVARDAFALVQSWTSRDWGWSPDMPPAERVKRVDLVAKWWKDNKESFQFPVTKAEQLANEKAAAAAAARGTSVPKEDPCIPLVQALGGTDAKETTAAESGLLGRGGAAVPALIAGLSDSNIIVTRKANDLLQRISKKTDIAFNPRATDEEKSAAIAAWTAWARQAGHLQDAEPSAAP